MGTQIIIIIVIIRDILIFVQLVSILVYMSLLSSYRTTLFNEHKDHILIIL